MTSQIRPHKQILHCNKDLERDKQYVAEISSPEQVAWIWCLCCAFLLPELGMVSYKMSIVRPQNFMQKNFMPHYIPKKSINERF